MRHGDWTLVQHMNVFQPSSMIGRDYEGISDNHDMVIVEAKKYVEETTSGASGPAKAASTCCRH